jgi:type IV pilus assembly protein PilQ
MSSKQGSIMSNKIGRFLYAVGLGLFLLLVQIAPVQASDLSLSNIGVVTLADSKLQIQLEMTGGTAVLPKIFQTDNPARIALDFSGVKNGLTQKMITVNQGTVSNIYVATSADRLRVVYAV